jgi:hypothetical protein
VKKVIILIAAVLVATATVLAGIAVLPSTAQNAQANPCSAFTITNNDDVDFKCKFFDDVEVQVAS